MVQRKRANERAADFEVGAGIHLAEAALRRYLREIDRIIRLRHLAFERFLEIASGAPGVEGDGVLLAIDGGEEGKSLNVVPVEMREEDVGADRCAVCFLNELLAE